MLSERMYRLLLLIVALPLMGVADVGRAATNEYNIDIVAIDLAGRQTNLTHDPGIDVSPAVARDGRIVFLSTRGNGGDLYVMNGDGRDVRRLTNSAVDDSGIASAEDLEWSQASWSPRGDEIAFDGEYWAQRSDCEQHCVNWRVLVVGSDSSALEEVAPTSRAPAWSPDGRRLAYRSAVDSYFAADDVTIAGVDGSSAVHLKTPQTPSSLAPVWSPRGGDVAFQGGDWIYVVRADGQRKRRLGRGGNPSWSPDGRRLAFVDDYKLFTVGRDGTRKRRLSRRGEFVVSVAWSPKGRLLGYVAGTKAPNYGGLPTRLRVETVTADGKRVRILARALGESLVWGAPVWSPNGRRMLVAVEPH